jgi:hypothetical protein
VNLESLALAIDGMQEQVKAGIGAEFTKHAYGALAPDNPHHWDSDGFYTARNTVELMHQGYPVPKGEQEFPVPADCPHWSSTFFVGSHAVRGFLRHAWVDMPEGASSGVVAILAHSPAPRISASVDGYFLEALTARHHVTTTLRWRLGAANPYGVLHLHCDAQLAFSPQIGRVSCMVGKPFWYR